MTSKVGVSSLSVEEPSGRRNIGEGAPLKKGHWTKEEDEILKNYVAMYGERNWSTVHKRTGLHRCGKSCRLRWANHLKPDLRKGAFTPEEEQLIIELHAQIGNKWVEIASELPGRTDNDIKNYWNTRLKRQRRAEKYLDPPDVCFNEFSEDNQNKELVTSSFTNSDPALFPINNKNIEIPTVEFKNFDPSQQLYPPGLLNNGFSSFIDIPGTSLVDQGLNASWNTRPIRSTVHPSKYITGSESRFSDRNVALSQPHNQYNSSFSGNIPDSHAPFYGNSSSESIWEHKRELPSIQTPMETWSLPSSIPPHEYNDLGSLSPRSSALLNGILYQSQTPKASWNNNSHQESSRFVVPDSCPVLRAIQWGTNADTISPSGHPITSMFNQYTPNIGGSLAEHQSIEPLIGFDVNPEMPDFAPTGRMDDPLNHLHFPGHAL